jgi:hypothetical protein
LDWDPYSIDWRSRIVVKAIGILKKYFQIGAISCRKFKLVDGYYYMAGIKYNLLLIIFSLNGLLMIVSITYTLPHPGHNKFAMQTLGRDAEKRVYRKILRQSQNLNFDYSQ